MGQKTSCIQGIPDWVGPYEKSEKLSSGSSGNSKEFYDRLHQLLTKGIDTKDYSALEDFLLSSRNKENLPSMKHGSSCTTEKCQTLKDSRPAVKTPLRIEEFLTNSLHKEISCKSVNFSDKPKDLKVVNVKPIIVRKDCAVHGTEHKCSAHVSRQVMQPHQHANCNQNAGSNLTTLTNDATPQKRITISHSSNSRTKIIQHSGRNSAHKSLQSPPPYRNPEAPRPVLAAKNSMPSQKLLSKQNDEKNCSVESQQTENDVNDFIKEWLRDLISSEKQTIRSSDFMAANEVQTAKGNIKRLEDKAESIVETFCVVSKHLEHCDWSRFSTNIGKLCDDIQKVLVDYINLKPVDTVEIKLKKCVTEALNKISSHNSDLKKMPDGSKCQDLWPLLRQLGDVLHELMEFLISKELKIIVKSIHSENKCVQMALCTLAEIATTGDFMTKIIVKIGGTKQLLSLCQTDCNSELRSVALRTLTLLCEDLNEPLQFELESYLSCIIPILAHEETEEQTKCEALALLVTILKYLENSPAQLQTKEYLNLLVTPLNELARTCTSSEISLLTNAAIRIITTRHLELPHSLNSHKLDIKSRFAVFKQESYV